MADTSSPVFRSAVIYRDSRAAMAWLEQAFGFETSLVVIDDKDALVHVEMRFGSGIVMIAHEWSEITRSPQSLASCNTQQLHVHIDGDVVAHCARARAAGAKIIQEPADQFYGDRTYRCIDPEGHVWTFAQRIKTMTLPEMEEASGLKLRDRL